MKRRSTISSLIFLGTIIFIIIGTLLMIRYAKGYRPTMEGTVKGTGLLAANSFPTGAEVYINDQLTSATDTTLNLDPGEYDVTIKKDGYYNWSKHLVIEKELVTQTNATLFPVSPTLEPLTFTGALNPIPSADGNEIAIAVASASAAAKNGLYIQELNSSPIALSRSARQIARSTPSLDFTKANYTWSPNGSQILVSFSTEQNYLLNTNDFNDMNTLRNITSQLPVTLADWEEELARQERSSLAKLPVYFLTLAGVTDQASGSAQISNLYLSPDSEKLLYQATNSLMLPEDLLPDLPSSSTQPETRDLTAGSWYVYDLKEDKNFEVAIGTIPSPSPSPSPRTKNTKAIKEATPAPIFTISKLLLIDSLKGGSPAELGSSPSAYQRLHNKYSTQQSIALFNAQYSPLAVTKIQWYPDSSHLILSNDQGIHLVEYDNTNKTTVYAGPFDPSFVYPWPDGSKIVTRIQFSPDTIPNLYTIKLK